MPGIKASSRLWPTLLFCAPAARHLSPLTLKRQLGVWLLGWGHICLPLLQLDVAGLLGLGQ